MPWKLKEQFGISYEREAAASYLVLHTGLPKSVFDYQVEMIRQNMISGILPMDSRQKNDTLYFYYNITSMLSLSQVLHHRKLKRNQFISIISAITKTILDCKGYLLNESCLVLDADHIYVYPDNLQISMVYLPLEQTGDINTEFREFMINLIIYIANIDDDGSDNFLQRKINCLKPDAFSIEKFYKLLVELASARLQVACCNKMYEESEDNHKNEESSISVDMGKASDRRKASGINEVLLPPVSHLKSRDDNVEKMGNKGKLKALRATDTKKAVKTMETVGTGSAVKSDARKEKPEIGQKRISYILGAVLIQAVFILFVIFSRNYTDSMKEDPASFYIGFAVAEIGINALIFRKLRSSMPKQDNGKAGQKPPVPISGSSSGNKEEKWSMTGHLNEIYGSEFETGKFTKKKTGITKQEEIENHGNMVTPVPEVKNIGKREETVLLQPDNEKYPCFHSVGKGEPLKILITKKDFLIGRLRDQVDFVIENNAVGKVHVQVTCHDSGVCYIRDLNSRNGTFINNQRLISNMDYELKSGDKVTLANSDFIFTNPYTQNSMGFSPE